MSLALQFDGSLMEDNTKGIYLKGKYTGVYGVNGVGDPVNLSPSQNAGVDGGVSDPNDAYNLIIDQPTAKVFPIGQDLNGYRVQFTPAAVPTLKLAGRLRMYDPTGTELATGAAYSAGVLAGSIELLVSVPTASQ